MVLLHINPKRNHGFTSLHSLTMVCSKTVVLQMVINTPKNLVTILLLFFFSEGCLWIGKQSNKKMRMIISTECVIFVATFLCSSAFYAFSLVLF